MTTQLVLWKHLFHSNHDITFSLHKSKPYLYRYVHKHHHFMLSPMDQHPGLLGSQALMKHSVLDAQDLTQSRAEIKNLPFKTNSQRIFKYRIVLQALTAWQPWNITW